MHLTSTQSRLNLIPSQNLRVEDVGPRQRTSFFYMPVYYTLYTSNSSSIYSLISLERVIQGSEAGHRARRGVFGYEKGL